MKPTFRLTDFRPDPAGDVREELESHLEMHVEALMEKGMSEGEARALAEEKLGTRRGIEREATRHAARMERKRRWSYQLDTLRQDLKYAARTLLRARMVTSLTLLLLALGIGANTALFSVLKGVLLDPLPLPDGNELVFLWEQSAEVPMYPASFANYLDWREQSRTIREMGAYLARHVNLTDGGESTRVRGALVTASLFSVFGVSPALGRALWDEEDFSAPDVVVLDHDLWSERYGAATDIIGERVELDGVPHTVVGVMPPGFQQPDPASMEPIQLWVPLPAGTQYEPRGSHSFQILGRAAGGMALQDVREDMARVAAALAGAHPESNQGAGIRVESAHQVLFGEAGKQILLVLGAAGLVLLMACGNIASLQLARSATRRGEMAIRGALGGGRGRILRQLITENALLALTGGAVGLLVAWWSLDLLRTLIPPDVPRAQGIGIDGAALLFTLATSLTIGVLFGLAPALGAARVRVAETLKEESRRDGGGGRGSRVQSAFIVGQFALSLVLANAALLLLQSYSALRGNEPGFRTEDVLTMELSLRGSGYSVVRGRAEFYDELLPRLRGLPGVREVGASTNLPMMAGSDARVVTEEDWTGDPGGFAQTMESERVVGDFFSALGVPLMAGRHFVRGEDDAGLGDYRAILNQAAAAALWPGDDPLGKRFSFTGDEPRWITVVGVVADVRNRGLGLDPLPELYLPYASFPTGRMFLTLRTEGDPKALAPAVLEEIRRVDPLQAVSRLRTMDEVVRSQLSGRELAAAGVFGVLSHHVASRTHEMGIRMALGSGEGNLLGLVIGQAGGMAALGLMLGLAGAYLSREVIQAYLYGVGPLEPLTLAWGAATLMGVALLAAVVPARRASRVDPVEVLRQR